MTGRMRMFARGWWKRPVLGFIIFFLYWNSILAWTDIREEPSVSIFLSGVCPDGRKAEEILETEAGVGKSIRDMFLSGRRPERTERYTVRKNVAGSRRRAVWKRGAL